MMYRLALPALALAVAVSQAAAMGHAAWDTDGDGMLTPEEFRTGFSALETHAIFDADGDGTLTEAEWSGSLSDVGDYANMDLNADGGVDADEYTAILFNRYDENGSATIDAEEMPLIEADLAAGGMLSN
ncbi:MAG: hypothetical protein WBA25_17550 [Jannaschia sp.]